MSFNIDIPDIDNITLRKIVKSFTLSLLKQYDSLIESSQISVSYLNFLERKPRVEISQLASKSFSFL